MKKSVIGKPSTLLKTSGVVIKKLNVVTNITAEAKPA